MIPFLREGQKPFSKPFGLLRFSWQEAMYMEDQGGE
jgi:hypothetical protein